MFITFESTSGNFDDFPILFGLKGVGVGVVSSVAGAGAGVGVVSSVAGAGAGVGVVSSVAGSGAGVGVVSSVAGAGAGVGVGVVSDMKFLIVYQEKIIREYS